MFRIKDFSLTVVLLSLFLLSVGGQVVTGFAAHNEERALLGQMPLATYGEYLRHGHFISALAENMESEFLQMGLFVLLTVWLVQRGSAESKSPDEGSDAREEAYSLQKRQQHPWLWRIYENSLSAAMALLFIFFFLLHAYGNHLTEMEKTKTNLSFWSIFATTEFWFESFQNWQSEFFSIAMLGLCSIFLRQKGSPQSKKLHESHWKTGTA